jgi:signal transduction histidine kinase
MAFAGFNAAELAGDWDVSALALECAGLGVWEIVAATGTWRCSPRCNELLGIANEDDPGDAFSGEDRERCREAIARALRGGEFWLEFRAQERWLSATGRVVRDRRGPASIVGTLQDITAQKVAIEDRELRLGEVAHDLLNPLAAVRLGVHVIRQGGPRTPEMLLRIDAIVSSVERIVAELLDFSRSHLRAPEQATVALSDVCRSVIAEASMVHSGREIVLKVHEDSIGEWDGERLRQVVRNLVGNALEHGEPTTPVEVSLIDFGDRAVLSVANRGPPVPEDFRAHLFEPFRRRSSKGRGVGFGLYIVKRIVEAHGGSVEMSSDEARTVFRVTLPTTGRPAEARG